MAVRVLVVDDHEPFRRAARAVIEETAGFELAGEVVDGESSIEAAESIRPDIVLMDINLPGMNGLEATRRIRATLPSTVVLLLSTREGPEFASQADACGAAAYLPKSLLSPDRLARLWARAGDSDGVAGGI
jgi:DNA-binding NarL/FixJ family response regulator